jgi:stage III sporulation protein AH
MKNIFKKNQIIITALAIMIAIAGYLNFSGRNDQDKNADFESGEVLDYETLTDDNILESDALELTDDGLVDDADIDTEDVEAADETAASDEDALVADEDMADAEEVANEDADSSEEVAQLDVSDTGEVVVDEDTDVAKADEDAKAEDSKDDEETSTPGEAILVSTTIEPNYFASARLSREQTRAKNKEALMEMLDSEKITEKERDLAVNEIIKLTADAEKEDATETLLQAKGFSDAIVDITDGNVDVIINAASVTEQDIAQVEDIVKRKTGAKSMDIHISAVVVQE